MPAGPTETLSARLARRYRLEVNTGTDVAPVWTIVRGINSFIPKIESNLENDTDFDSDGWESQIKTSQSWSLEVELFSKQGINSKESDEGYLALEAKSDKLGGEAIVQVRWYDRNGGEDGYTGYASLTWDPAGGTYKDLDTVKVMLAGVGKRERFANPV